MYIPLLFPNLDVEWEGEHVYTFLFPVLEELEEEPIWLDLYYIHITECTHTEARDVCTIYSSPLTYGWMHCSVVGLASVYEFVIWLSDM